MKEIFDWLREQINKHSYSKYDRGNWFASFIPTKIAIDLINEAEAKWESENCTECENCGTKVEKDSNGDYVCGRCGRNTARLRELEEESDCCEWKFEKNTGLVWHCENECESYNISYQRELKTFLEEFECKCPYCGKPIKISEVE